MEKLEDRLPVQNRPIISDTALIVVAGGIVAATFVSDLLKVKVNFSLTKESFNFSAVPVA